MARFKIVARIDEDIFDEVKEYDTVEEVLKDMAYRDPMTFFVGDSTDMMGYTLSQFNDKFGEGNVKFCSDCEFYDEWVDYNDYGGLVNECKECDLFCFSVDEANKCPKFKERVSKNIDIMEELCT